MKRSTDQWDTEIFLTVENVQCCRYGELGSNWKENDFLRKVLCYVFKLFLFRLFFNSHMYFV